MNMKPLSFVIGILLADAASAGDFTVVNSISNTTNSIVVVNCVAPNAATQSAGEGQSPQAAPTPCPGGGNPPPPHNPPSSPNPPGPSPAAVYAISVPFGTPGDFCNAPNFCLLAHPQPDAHTKQEIDSAVGNWNAAHPDQTLGPGSTITVCTPAGCTKYTLDHSGNWGDGVFTSQQNAPPYYPPPSGPSPPGAPTYPPVTPPDNPPEGPPGTVGPIQPGGPAPCVYQPGGPPCAEPN